MSGSPINGSVYSPRLLHALRGAEPVLIEAGEGMGKTSFAQHVMQQNTSSLEVMVSLDNSVASILETIWRAYGKQVRALIEEDASHLMRMKNYGGNAGSPLQMVVVDLTEEAYPVDEWFYRRVMDGADENDVNMLRAKLNAKPEHTPVKSAPYLLDGIKDCSRALGLGEHPSTLWIDVSPHFDWAVHGANLAELLSRPVLRDTRYLKMRLLMHPSDIPRLRDLGVDMTSVERHELMWTFDELLAMADQQTAGWFGRFASHSVNQSLLRKLYDDALKPSTRTLAPSPKCWIYLAKLLKDRKMLHVQHQRDWYYTIRDCCAATRKLRIGDDGIFIGGDRLDQSKLIKPKDVSILKAIHHLQNTLKGGLPTAGEVAQYMNLHRIAREPANADNVMRSVWELRRRVCFEPVFRFLRNGASESDDSDMNDCLVYLCNADTKRRYQLRNIE